VLAATIEGGITGGGSVVKRLVIKSAVVVTSEIIKSTVDADLGDIAKKGVDGVKIETDRKKIASNTIKGVVANVVGKGTGKVLKKVTNGTHVKQLTKTEKELKKSMNGSKGELVRAEKKADLKATINGNKVVAEATGTVVDEVVDNKIKN
jgi:hypothetical protein